MIIVSGPKGSLLTSSKINAHGICDISIHTEGKLKIYRTKATPNTHVMKFSTEKGDTLMSLTKEQQRTCFVELIRVRMLKETNVWP